MRFEKKKILDLNVSERKAAGIFLILLFLISPIAAVESAEEEKNELDDELNIAGLVRVVENPPDAISVVVSEPVSASATAAPFAAKVSTSKYIFVDDDFIDDPANHKWDTIQEGVNDASNGDTVFVYAGNYCENVVVNKSISLIGNGSAETIVESNGTGAVFYVAEADGVKISGFCIENGELGIAVEDADNTTISDCVVRSNSEFGIYVHNGRRTEIRNCSISENYKGLLLMCRVEGSVLKNNTFHNNTYNFGVWSCKPDDYYLDIDATNTINGKPIYYIVEEQDLVFDGSTGAEIGFLGLVGCKNITVKNHTFVANYNGLILVETEDSIIEGCTVSDCYWAGIFLGKYSKNNAIKNCSIHDVENRCIYIWSKADNNQVVDCTLYNCEIGIYTLASNTDIANCRIYNCSDRGIGFTKAVKVRDCRVSDCHWGIVGRPKSGNLFTGNTLWNNTRNFGFVPTKRVSDFKNQAIDSSNTVNGKPVYYVVGQKDMVFNASQDIGFLCSVECENVLIENLEISNNYNGILLVGTKNATVSNCTVSECHYAIALITDTTDCVVENCTTYNNSHGVFIAYDSANNTVSGCDSHDNKYGFWIHFCSLPANVLRDNVAWRNEQNFVLRGGDASQFKQKIDRSNTADGKTVYHLVEEQDLVFDGVEVGWFGLVGCENITAKNLVFQNNDQAALLVSSTNVTIEDCEAFNTSRGISLYYGCCNITIKNCTAHDNGFGMYFYKGVSEKNLVENCEFYNNAKGIYSYDGASRSKFVRLRVYNNTDEGLCLYKGAGENEITRCEIANNKYGIYLDRSSNNSIYLNDFKENTKNVVSCSSDNFWNSTEKITYTYKGKTFANYMGNYWDDYTGSDANGDGIGDTPYSIDSDKDYYPLMERFENYFAPAPTPTPTPTPSIPEFPAYSLLIAASCMIALAFMISMRKKSKSISVR